MRVYDPCSGSGGMLILVQGVRRRARRQRARPGSGRAGDERQRLGHLQDEHAAPRHPRRRPASNDDTLADPQHVEGGELMRFDRVITNPPFSLNYTTRDGMPFPERFRYG